MAVGFKNFSLRWVDFPATLFLLFFFLSFFFPCQDSFLLSISSLSPTVLWQNLKLSLFIFFPSRLFFSPALTPKSSKSKPSLPYLCRLSQRWISFLYTETGQGWARTPLRALSFDKSSYSSHSSIRHQVTCFQLGNTKFWTLLFVLLKGLYHLGFAEILLKKMKNQLWFWLGITNIWFFLRFNLLNGFIGYKDYFFNGFYKEFTDKGNIVSITEIWGFWRIFSFI